MMRRSSSKAGRWLRSGLPFALCFGLFSRPTWAVDSPAELVAKGLELRRARRDSEALALFQTAYSTSAEPMILGQIALAEQALGRWGAAERDLGSVLSTHDDWVDAHRSALETARTVIQSHLSSLSVTSNVESAELWLDDQDLGKANGIAVRVAAGKHELSLRASDTRSIAQPVELAAGEHEHFHLEFPEPTRTAVRVPPLPEAPPASTPAAPMPVAPPTARHSSSTRQGLAYGSGALAIVALGEAVTASLVRLHYAHRYNGDDCAPNRSQRCAPYRNIANTWGDVALTGYIVAGAAGLGSLALFTVPYWSPRTATSAGVVGLAVSGRF